MTVTGVVEHARPAAGANARQHAWHHRTQACPGNDPLGRDRREQMPRPGDKWVDPHIANVAVVAIELGSAGDAEAVGAEPAADDLAFIVQQADPGCAGAARRIVQLHRDRIALDRVDVDAITQRRPKPAALDAGTNHDGVAVKLMRGRYGPYVTDGTINATVPSGTEPLSVTLEQALGLIAERAAKGGGKKAKARAKPKAKAKVLEAFEAPAQSTPTAKPKPKAKTKVDGGAAGEKSSRSAKPKTSKNK